MVKINQFRFLKIMMLGIMLGGIVVGAMSFRVGGKTGTTPYVIQYDTTILGEPYIPADNPMTQEGVRLGKLLFYDHLLSSTTNRVARVMGFKNFGSEDTSVGAVIVSSNFFSAA